MFICFGYVDEACWEACLRGWALMWAASEKASMSRSSMIAGCWLVVLQGHLTCQQVIEIVLKIRPAVVAVDSPRSCAPDGQTARDGELQLAKSICGIRWTPDERRVHASAYYAWIVEGLALFGALAACDVEVIEVFPTASWTRWRGPRGSQSRAAWTRQGLAALGLAGIPARTNQDQRDALAAAMTASQHSRAQTETMGEIVVPAAHP